MGFGLAVLDFCFGFVYCIIWSLELHEVLLKLFKLVCFPLLLLYNLLFEIIPLSLSHTFRHLKLLSLCKYHKLKTVNVVVVGGGFLGSAVCQLLQGARNVNVTLVDPKGFFEFTPSCPRLISDPARKRHIQIPFTDFLHKKQATFIQNEVVKVDKSHISLKNQDIPFDYLVIATGSFYQLPPNLQTSTRLFNSHKADHMFRAHERLLSSSRVLVIGGGITGVELAAEIATSHPDKKVTLVHSGKNLLPSIRNEGILRYVHKFLMDHNVTVILNQRVVAEERNGFATEDQVLPADIAFFCGNGKPNSRLISGNNDGIEVNQYFQYVSNSNIYAGGDILSSIDHKVDEKLAQNAELHAEFISNNILISQEHFGGGPAPLESYTPYKKLIVVSLGKYDGLIIWNNLFLTGFITALVKEAIEWKTTIRYASLWSRTSFTPTTKKDQDK